MAKGKHGARARRRREVERQQALHIAETTLGSERERAAMAENMAVQASVALEELARLREQAEAMCAAQVAELRSEISSLSDLLTQIMSQRDGVAGGSAGDLAAQMLFGQKPAHALLASVMEEAERRLVEKFPEEYAPALEGLTILATVSPGNARRLGMEATHRIEQARRSKGKSFRQGNQVYK